MAHFWYSRQSASGFTLVELLVSILIFSFGFASVYLLVDSSSRLSVGGKNMITASQLAREQIELVKNMRDTNWLQMKYWDSLQNARQNQDTLTPARFSSGYYFIENRKTNPGVAIQSLSAQFGAQKEQLIEGLYQTRLCRDSLGRYTHDCSNDAKQTIFASFLEVTPLVTQNNVLVQNAWKVVSWVTWYDRGYHEVSFPFILTDWKK